MIKVILATEEGQKTDLFPESFSIRDVFREFHEEYVGRAVLVDGELIPDDKQWSSMREYCRGSTMRIAVSAIPEKAEETDPQVESVPSEEDAFRSIYDEMIAIRDKLNGLINKLEDQHPEWTVPF